MQGEALGAERGGGRARGWKVRAGGAGRGQDGAGRPPGRRVRVGRRRRRSRAPRDGRDPRQRGQLGPPGLLGSLRRWLLGAPSLARALFLCRETRKLPFDCGSPRTGPGRGRAGQNGSVGRAARRPPPPPLASAARPRPQQPGQQPQRPRPPRVASREGGVLRPRGALSARNRWRRAASQPLRRGAEPRWARC